MIKATLGFLLSLFLALHGPKPVPATITLNIDLSSAAERPTLVVIKKHGLGAYAVTSDTSKVSESKFSIKSPLPETEIQDIIFIWPSGLRKTISFRAFPGEYLDRKSVV